MAVVVVGGGIGGLAAALAIAATGQPVRVLEQAERFTEIGAGIQLGPNATAVLEQFNVFDSLRPTAVFPDRILLMNAVNGQPITEIDLGDSFVDHFGSPYVVLHRADLLAALLEACEQQSLIQLEPNREVVGIEQSPARVRITCRDGSTYDADGAVGADGLWSRVRRLIVDDEPLLTGDVAFRGVARLGEIRELQGFHEVLMWVGPRFHFVQYPLRGGELLNEVAVFKSTPGETPGTTELLLAEFDEVFAAACPRVSRDRAHIQRDRHWVMQERAPLARWTKGRVTLLGDAAHAMLQYIAQGACQAFEDAACLGEAFRSHGDDVEAAFDAYDRERAPRTAQVQRAARQWGEICHLDGVAVTLRDRLLGARKPGDYGDIDWLYGPGPSGLSRSLPPALEIEVT